MPRKILALDLATTFGWCYGEAGTTPEFGSHCLGKSGTPNEEVFLESFRWARDFVKANHVDMIVIEKPADPRHMRQTTFDTAIRLMNIPGHFSSAAWACGVRDIRYTPVISWRSFILGGRAPKGQEKQAVMSRLDGLGFHVEQSDAADAVGIWLYANATMHPECFKPNSELSAMAAQLQLKQASSRKSAESKKALKLKNEAEKRAAKK